MTGPIIRPGSVAVNVVTGASEQDFIGVADSPGVAEDLNATFARVSRAGTIAFLGDSGLSLNESISTVGRYGGSIPTSTVAHSQGRLILVSGITPTAAGEGKSTVAVGLTQALKGLGKNAIVCLREPSLGPVFGVKLVAE